MKINLLISTLATKRDAAYMERQLTCLQSWHDYAWRVCCLNPRADLKDLKHVESVEPIEAHPTLAQFIQVAAKGRGLADEDTVGIINADVGLQGSLDKLDHFTRKRQIFRAYAASSQRIEGEAVVPWAYDLFIATKKVWKEIINVPAYLKLGEPMWDIWLNGYFNKHVADPRYIDLTSLGIVNHVEHEKGREIDPGMNTVEVTSWGPPAQKLH